MTGNTQGVEVEELEDQNLFENLRDYFQSSMAVFGSISEIVGDDSLERKLLNKGDNTARGQSPRNEEQTLEQIRESMKSRWIDLPEYNECIASFKSSSLYKKELGLAKQEGVVEDVDKPEEHIKQDSLPRIFYRYLELNQDFSFNEKKFKQTYAEFERYLKSEQITYNSKAILWGFSMQNDEVELEDGLSIQKVSKSEVKGSPPHYLLEVEDKENIPAMVQTHKVNKFGDLSPEDAMETFKNVVLALRLFDISGDVGIRFATTNSTSIFKKENRRVRVADSHRFFDEEYSMDSEDCERFSDFYSSMKNQIREPPETYRIALDKFSNSFKRYNENDRLLDSVIALEALYLKAGEQQEMSFRLSQRGAILLADGDSEPSDIKKRLKDAYDTRSTLVHGGEPDVEQEFIYSLHETTRKTLSKFLKRSISGEKHEEIISGLDQEAISS